jgi:hypothetical protein
MDFADRGAVDEERFVNPVLGGAQGIGHERVEVPHPGRSLATANPEEPAPGIVGFLRDDGALRSAEHPGRHRNPSQACCLDQAAAIQSTLL